MVSDDFVACVAGPSSFCGSPMTGVNLHLSGVLSSPTRVLPVDSIRFGSIRFDSIRLFFSQEELNLSCLLPFPQSRHPRVRLLSP